MRNRGYTLVELIVAMGIFAIVMLLTTGAYLTMTGINRQAQGLATASNSLAFALENMTRSIRTGSQYGCNGGGDCSGGSTFSFTPSGASGPSTYGLSSGAITLNGAAITDPSVTVTGLAFYLTGSSAADALQPKLTVVVSGTITTGPGKTLSFTVETGAAMRGADI